MRLHLHPFSLLYQIALLTAMLAFFSNLWQSFQTDGLAAFTHIADVREAAVASWFRSASRSSPAIFPYPLLTPPQEDHFIDFESKCGVPALVASARGVVLELGPGTGNQLRNYDAAAVTFVYGAEPNRHFAADMDRAVARAGLQDKYELILCGVEDSEALARHGIVEGTLDTVLSIQVLCSVPQPAAVARQLHRLLKPGGRLIFWEHTRSSDAITTVFQSNSPCANSLFMCAIDADAKRCIRFVELALGPGRGRMHAQLRHQEDAPRSRTVAEL